MPFLSVYAGLEVHVHVHGHVQADTGYVLFYFCNDCYLYSTYETQKKTFNLLKFV